MLYPFWFLRQDMGSNCNSSRSLPIIFTFHSNKQYHTIFQIFALYIFKKNYISAL